MVIQIILIATAVVLFVFFIRSSHSVRTQAFKRIGFVIFLFLSLDAVLRPNDTTWLAHKVGVGRGADLLLYMLVAAFAFFAVNTFLRFRNLERRFTDLARAIALRDAQAPSADPARGGQAHDTTQTPAFPAQAAREETPEPETSLSGGSSR